MRSKEGAHNERGERHSHSLEVALRRAPQSVASLLHSERSKAILIEWVSFFKENNGHAVHNKAASGEKSLIAQVALHGIPPHDKIF